MRKNSRRKILSILSVCFAVSVGFGVTACGANESKEKGPEYDYQYNKPFSDECDEYMTIDGKLDEEAWQGQKELVHSSDGVQYTVTTVLSEKGVYIGAVAYDNYIYWERRNDFSNNSSFEFKIVGPDEMQSQEDIDKGEGIDLFDHAYFNIDYLTCRSYREQRYASAAYVDGEINLVGSTQKKTTKSLSVEIFIKWDQFNVDTSKYEKGYPDFIRLYSSYRKIDGESVSSKTNLYLKPMSMETNRLESYFQFDENGLCMEYQSDIFGNANNGPSATDQWTIEETETDVVLSTPVNRTQILWFKDGLSENYEITARITPSEINDINEAMNNRKEYENPHVGFISYSGASSYSLFAVAARVFDQSKTLQLKTASLTDGLQYFAKVRLDEKIYNGNYTEDSVDLRMVKVGGDLYYFYKLPQEENWTFWDAETVGEVSGKAYVGLFTNGATTFSRAEYKDWSDNENALLEDLKNYVYYLNIPSAITGGTLGVSKTVIKKGGLIRLEMLARTGYMMTDMTANGVSIFSDIEENKIDGRYYDYLITDEDIDENNAVYLVPTFSKFEKSKLKNVSISFVDKKDAAQSLSYSVVDENGLLYYRGTAVGQGKANLELPIGEFTFGDRTINFSGKYTLTTETATYIKSSLAIDLADASKIVNGVYQDKFIVQKTNYGEVTVNDIKTGDETGALSYDAEKEIYYATGAATNGAIRQYFLDGVAENFVIDAHIYTEKIDASCKNVPGVILSGGGTGRTIEFKLSPNDSTKSKLFINLGNLELSVNGFANTLTNAGGGGKFKIVRYDGNIFVYADGEDSPAIVLSASGIQVFGDRTIAAVTQNYTLDSLLGAFNGKLRAFFVKTYKENAIGVVCHYTGGMRGSSYYDIKYNTSEAYVKQNYIDKLSFVDFNAKAGEEYSLTVNGVAVVGKYLENTTMELGISYYDQETIAMQIELLYEDGTTELVNGKYSLTANKSTFKFIIKAGLEGYSVKETIVRASATISMSLSEIISENATVTLKGESNYGIAVEMDLTNEVLQANGEYSIELDHGTYMLVVTNGENRWYKEIVLMENVTLNLAALNEASYFYTDAVKLNDATLSSKAVLFGEGNTVTLPASGSGQKFYYMPNTKTTGDFTYTVKMSGTGSNKSMPGVSIFTDTGKVTFMVSDNEAKGKKIIVDIENGGTTWHDFVINTKALNPTNVYEYEQAIDVTFKIVKTSDSISLWLPTANGYVKAILMSADGTIGIPVGTTCTSDRLTDATTVNAIQSFFETGAEVCCGLGTNNQSSETTFTLSYEKTAEQVVATSGKFYTGEVNLNGKWILSSQPINSENDSLTLPITTSGQKFYYMPNTKTTGNFTYTVKMSGTGSNKSMPGASIFTDTGKITFMVSDNEGQGKKIIVDVENNGTTWHDFVIDTIALNLTNVYKHEQSADVTFKIVKTATAIELYAPTANGEVKVLSMNADGSITLAEGATCSNSRLTDDTTKAGIKSFFEEGAEICCGLGTNNQTGATTFAMTFAGNK